MANKIYQSKYGRNKVTCAQYITEIICERKAEVDKISLPLFFWRDKKWFGYYIFQLKLCNKLLVKFSEAALVHVVISNKNIFSLRNPTIQDKCYTAEKYLQKIVKNSSEQEEFRYNIDKQSKRYSDKNKLEDL